MTFLARLEELIDSLEGQIAEKNQTIKLLSKELNNLKNKKD